MRQMHSLHELIDILDYSRRPRRISGALPPTNWRNPAALTPSISTPSGSAASPLATSCRASRTNAPTAGMGDRSVARAKATRRCTSGCVNGRVGVAHHIEGRDSVGGGWRHHLALDAFIAERLAPRHLDFKTEFRAVDRQSLETCTHRRFRRFGDGGSRHPNTGVGCRDRQGSWQACAKARKRQGSGPIEIHIPGQAHAHDRDETRIAIPPFRINLPDPN